MNEINYNIDSAKDLLKYLKSAGSQIKMQNKGAEIIIKNLSEHQVALYTDNDGKLFQKMSGRAAEETTVDDVVDLVCEYNYEDIYFAGQEVEAASDFVGKCKANKRHEELQAEGRILDRIFSQTKYGRKVNMVADRICSELFTQLNLIPIYNLPFYEDKKAADQSDLENDSVSEDKIVSVEAPAFSDKEPEEVVEQSKGAR